MTTDESVSDESTVPVKVLGMDANIPMIQLYYPTGGEVVSGTVTLDWFAADSNHQGESLPIYLFLLLFFQIEKQFFYNASLVHGQSMFLHFPILLLFS